MNERIVKQSYKIIDNLDRETILKKLEYCGRVAYQSHDMSDGIKSAQKFLYMLIDKGHESVLEHVSITVEVVTNRAIANEIVRHRIASYTQSSTRYCDYSKDRMNKEIRFIEPIFNNDEHRFAWYDYIRNTVRVYGEMSDQEILSDCKRGILPLDTATEIVMTMNLREWRHFFRLRTSKSAHYQIRELAIEILRDFRKQLPEIFYDITIES